MYSVRCKDTSQKTLERAIKVVILAGGKGTRLSEETRTLPKPLIEVGGRPLLQHIIDIFSQQGFSDFILATGYKSNAIVGYFLDTRMSYTKAGDEIIFHDNDKKITLINTGLETMTGGRLKKLESYLTEPFVMTYGDGLGNVNVFEAVNMFETHQSLVTVTAVHPAGRFGSVHTSGDRVVKFGEKVDAHDWINGGFMVIHPDALQYICNGDVTNWEADCLPKIADDGRMTAYRHEKFWYCIDTLRDLEHIEKTYREHGSIWLES